MRKKQGGLSKLNGDLVRETSWFLVLVFPEPLSGKSAEDLSGTLEGIE